MIRGFALFCMLCFKALSLLTQRLALTLRLAVLPGLPAKRTASGKQNGQISDGAWRYCTESLVLRPGQTAWVAW